MEEQKIIILLIILTISGITDILKGKIYNIITFPGIIMGIALGYYYNGVTGLLTSFGGFGVAGLIFIVLYIWGGFGAGDVKLMMAIGAIVGIKFIFDFIFYSAIAGGIIANIVIIKNKRFVQSWKNVLRFFLFLIPKWHLKSVPLRKENSISIPFGYAISIGSLLYILFQV